MKPGRTGLKRLYYAGIYSAKGLKAAWRNEAAFRQEVCIVVPLFITALLLPVSAIEQLFLVSSLFLVLITELFNSSIEAVVDRISDELHELSGRAKDIGSAAVLVSIFLAVFIWSWVLL
ncbi:Diacylglycerol kinase [Vibrio aerogenes CECT 7868]|uniref:Diacylglycerol kinase n=1 Tax=Vibrio aerogenes CECT 7868 TaxID=1216006 RepID=A0A1M5ZNS3_9VIBR|nr:diacylglycerol kinase [Vibrio aerogenes]SHI25769.1 Diacylglycerol kinase [Vibrio aerogenes CECT 7868]